MIPAISRIRDVMRKGMFIAIDKLNVQARIYHQPQGQEQEEHLEGWKVRHLHATEIVANHIARTQYQVADATEHAPIAQAPDIQEKQERILERVAPYLGRLTATGAVVAPVMRSTCSALVLFFGEWCHLMRLQFPLLVSLVSIVQILHSLHILHAKVASCFEICKKPTK